MKKKTRIPFSGFPVKLSKKAGLPPGSLIYTGYRTGDISIEFINYNETEVNTIKNPSVPIPELLEEGKVNWLNVIGLHNTEIIDDIGKKMNIHPLVLEDILNINHPPKIELTDENLFITLKIFHIENNNKQMFKADHCSFILGTNYLLSFLEEDTRLFDNIKDRILNFKGKVRTRKNDYLAYLLTDALVDNYLVVLDSIGLSLEEFEQNILEYPEKEYSESILFERKRLIELKKMFNPLKEDLRKLQKSESTLFERATFRYMNDVLDHLNHINEALDGYREIINSLVELNAANQANKMNQVMKTLTVIATIFIPLTFIAGVYGMNFKFMPELNWQFGYPLIWLIFISVGLGMIYYMKKKLWL